MLPCDDIGAEAEHKGANEGADLLGGPLSPVPLLIQTSLAHAGEAQWSLLVIVLVTK